MKNAYENYLRRIIGNKDIPVDESQWEAMRERLKAEGLVREGVNSEKRTKSSPWMGILAAAMLLTGVALGWVLKSTPPVDSTPTVVSTQQDQTTNSLQSSKETITKIVYQPTAPTMPQYVYSPMPYEPKMTSSANSQRYENQTITSFKVVNKLPAVNMQFVYDQPEPTHRLVTQSIKTQNTISDKDQQIKEYNELIKRELENQQAALAWQDEADHQRMNYGVKGGVFSGTGQSGFSGTVNVQRNFKNNFILESDLGVINSLGSSGAVMPAISAKTSSASGLSLNTTDGLFYTNLESGARIVDNERVRYTFSVFNPSAGYQINDRFTVKMGLDFQALMSGEESNTYIKVEDKYFRMARYDFGLTPKLNVKLNNRLSGEFVYRNGLNSSFLGSEYWNRNYFFAQLNFNFR